MNVPEHWLRSMADPSLTTDGLAHLLTMSGLEVEHVATVAPPFAHVVAARVVSVAKHPEADRLSVCAVDAGGETLQVVCGAPNVRAGMMAPLAKVGARLPGGLEIRVATMRGVESRGMLCSARELGISEEHEGLLELDRAAAPGEDVRALLALDEAVLTLKLTPNKADCLSILGIAREVAALAQTKLTIPDTAPVPARNAARHPIAIDAPEGCGRFAGRVIRGVDARAPTPEWMKRRLARAGQRSISALVDVTNYVMLELGRPLHVYDADKLQGTIRARWGRKGERVRLLNEQTVEVDENVLCIADDSGAIGLGGIMGGDSTKADLGTKNIFVESAFFFPEAVQGRARRFGFSSDASHRFERGVDFDNNLVGLERYTQLVLAICGGEPGPVDDVVARLPERRPVRMRVARAQKVIGMPIPATEMAEIFTRLELPFTTDGSTFVVTPPSFRFDLAIEEDLIEEVARVHGFEKIPAHPPVARAAMRLPVEARRSLHAVRERLAACDYFEAVNFSFVEPGWEADFAGVTDPIRLLNPIASPLSVMRTSLIGSLVANVRTNLARKVGRIRMFEVGRVFIRDAAEVDGPRSVTGIRQPMRVGAIAFGPALEEQWGVPTRDADFFDVKADVEAMFAPRVPRFEAAPHPAMHPGRSARVLLDGRAVGWLGELHPRWQQKYELPRPAVVFELDAAVLEEAPIPEVRAPSKYPPVIRDLSFLVPSTVAVQALLDAIAAEKPPIVRDVSVFDLYAGTGLPEGRKSLAFRVVMQDTERTLTDAEADAARDALFALLGRRFSAAPRT